MLRCIFILLSITHFSLFVFAENDRYENSLFNDGNRGESDENLNSYTPERNNRGNRRRENRNNRRRENERYVRPEEPNNDNSNEISSGGERTEWTYENQQKWRKVNASCGGKSQSPIDIIEGIERNENLQADVRFGRETGATLENTGHTVQLSLDRNITFSGPAANFDTYRLQQLHFHWGENDDEGSEHGLFGQKFSAEMHFVFYNTKYGSFQRAAGRKDGLTVLGVFLQASDLENENLSPIVDGLRNVRRAESKTRIEIEIEKLLPKAEDIFYRYFGSLTTPPCSEVVNWIVFQTPMRIGIYQLKALRELEDERGNKLTTNWRYLQNRNGRLSESSAPKY